MPPTFAERPRTRPQRPEADSPSSLGPTADLGYLDVLQKSAELTVDTIDDELARNERTANFSVALGVLVMPEAAKSAAREPEDTEGDWYLHERYAQSWCLIEKLDKAQSQATQQEKLRPTLAEDLPFEEVARHDYYRFLGEISAKQVVDQETRPARARGPTLAKTIVGTKRGDAEAERRMDINIGTATTEGFYKEGHITEVKKQLDDNGDVVQYGLTTKDMQHDSLVLRPNRPKELKQFTLAEARDGFREQVLARAGVLEDYWLVVPSCVPEELPEEQLDYRGDGYFTRTMTFAVQGTTQEGRDLTTQTVFVKGTDADGSDSYAARQAGRFDIKAIGRVYEKKLGLRPPQSALELIESPACIPKKMMPNGMVDFWRWVDEAKDELRGEIVERTTQEYLDHIKQSRERETSLAGVKQKIKQALLDRADTFSEGNDMEAVDALWELVRDYGVQESITNKHINPYVFGAPAASRIERARYYVSIGDMRLANRWMRSAGRVATMSGCGGGAGARNSNASQQGTGETGLGDLNHVELEGEQSVDEGGEKKWRWEKGKCRIPSCPSRPGTTMIGPCKVCWGCQKKFDKGLDPTKDSAPPSAEENSDDLATQLRELFESLQLDKTEGRGKKSDYVQAA